MLRSLLILALLVTLGYGAVWLLPVFAFVFWYAIAGLSIVAVIFGLLMLGNYGARLLFGEPPYHPKR